MICTKKIKGGCGTSLLSEIPVGDKNARLTIARKVVGLKIKRRVRPGSCGGRTLRRQFRFFNAKAMWQMRDSEI